MIGNRYAIIVGVDKYQQSATWSQLPYVRGDIDGLEQVLVRELGVSFTFPKERIIKLCGFDATSDKIEKAFNEVSNKAGLHDLVLVYFSGHGIIHEFDRPVLVTYETDCDKPHKTGVTFTDVEAFVKSLRAQVVLVVDTCFSGRILKEKDVDIEIAKKYSQYATERFGRLAGLAVFASCQAEQVSRPGKDQTQSLFTQHFIAGLKGAGCALEAGEVTTNSLKNYLETVFTEETQKPAILIPEQPITLSVPECSLGNSQRVTQDPWRDYLSTYCIRYRNSLLYVRSGFVDLEYEIKRKSQKSYDEELNGAHSIVSELRGLITKSKVPLLTVLLGDVGSGKTTLLRRLWFELAELRLKDDGNVPFPIWISLSDFRNIRFGDELTGEQSTAVCNAPRSFRGILVDTLQYEYNLPISWSTLQQECSDKPLVVIFDGFDEMVVETSNEGLTAAFRLLMLFLTWGAKVIVSCRTHFLRSDEELNTIISNTTPPETEIVIFKCQKFTPAQVQHYIDVMSATTEVAYRCKDLVSKAFKGTAELARRPFLLEILINSIPSKIPKVDISEKIIFEDFLNGWLRRDRWRFVRFLIDYKEAIERESTMDIVLTEQRYNGDDSEVRKAEDRVRHFIELLADGLPLEKKAKIHYSEIPAIIRNRYPTLPEIFLNFFEYVIRTCSFLIRDSEGNYEFLHPSIQAYFAAWAVMREIRRDRYGWDEQGRLKTVPKALGGKLLDPRIHEYVCDMIDQNDEAKLVDLARLDTKNNPYSLRYLTGNIILILKKYRRHDLSGLLLDRALICNVDLSGSDLSNTDLQQSIIDSVDLRDTNFNGTMIEGAKLINVNLKGAKLSGVKLKNGGTVVKDPIIDETTLRNAPEIFRMVVSQSEKGERVYDVPKVDPIEIKLIQGGRFLMGSNNPNSPSHEKPAHEVEIDNFWIDIHPVTNRQFAKFVKANPDWGKEAGIARTKNVYYLSLWMNDSPPAALLDHPVVYVSWFAAVAYAEWAGKRLPTEAEWEYALRNKRHLSPLEYPWGNTYNEMPKALREQLEHKPSEAIQELSKKHPDLAEIYGQKATHKTGVGYANDYGLYDMSGNVNELVQDWFDQEYWEKNKHEIYKNPIGAPYGQMKILRGGSFLNHSPLALTCSYRRFLLPHNTNQDGGFRCAKDA